ncbi:MAG: PTS sugar transporter subunit IIC [Clostridiales bacterium]|nr:PTS sugar transporter subunit IIC [Clostridiales bacterium]
MEEILQENETQKPSVKAKLLAYLKALPKRYFITAFSGMAQGLFVTLIAGTILEQIAGWIGDNYIGNTLLYIANIAKSLMGAGIGVGIAHALGKNKLLVFSSAVVGMVGAFAGGLVFGGTPTAIALTSGAPGNPIGAYVVTMFVIEIVSLYAGKTKLDIILIPLGAMLLAVAGVYVAWPFIQLIDLLAKLLVITINAGEAVKIIVGVLIAVVMGILLTMPTSSAAIWIAIARSETALSNPEVFAIAGGAAVAGCAAHMIGFAVATFKENKVSGLISQGIGTSMLQIPNIMKKPIIMLPEIIASAISGLVAVLLNIRCTDVGGGMGTSGLVGLFGVIDACSAYSIPVVNTVLGIVLCLFVIPAVVSFFASEFMRKKGWIKEGDMLLPD